MDASEGLDSESGLQPDAPPGHTSTLGVSRICWVSRLRRAVKRPTQPAATCGPAWGSWNKFGPVVSHDRPEAMPEVLGRFRIIRELGRGGFGVVFLAEDPILDRLVALKVPRLEVLSHGAAWRQFRREALAASRLDHPNLVPLLETGEIGPVGYIASVFVEGPSLEAWIAEHGSSLSPRQSAQTRGNTGPGHGSCPSARYPP